METYKTRRTAIAALGAIAATPAVSLGGVIAPPTGSHIFQTPGALGSPYEPPITLSTAVDLFHRMTAPVSLNGHGPYPFVVDTGANQSVISQELALALNLPEGAPQLLHSVAGARLTRSAVLETLAAGDVVENAVVLSVLPEEALGGPGLLGVDHLGDQRLTLDFAGQKLQLQASRHARRNPDDFVLAVQRRSGQLSLVDAEMMGRRVTAFLDTGAQSSIGNLALRALAEVQIPENRWSAAPILSATGDVIQGERAVLPAFRIGQLLIGQLAVVFADLHTFRLWSLEERPAILLGIDVLSQFQTVALDYPRGEVRLQLPKHYTGVRIL